MNEFDLTKNVTVNLERLWHENKELIQKAAHNYKNITGISEDIEDLVQDGFFGLKRAAETYDPVQYPDVSFGVWIVIKCCSVWSKYLHDLDPLRNAASIDTSIDSTKTAIGNAVADGYLDVEE